jgi:hypothetical protein
VLISRIYYLVEGDFPVSLMGFWLIFHDVASWQLIGRSHQAISFLHPYLRPCHQTFCHYRILSSDSFFHLSGSSGVNDFQFSVTVSS